MTPYDTALFEAMRAAIRQDSAGRPLPAGQRRYLSKSESYAIAEGVRQRGGFSESGAHHGEAVPRGAASVVPGSVAATRPEWLAEGYVNKVVAEVAERTARVVRLETDPAKLAAMSSEALSEHVAAVAEAAEAIGSPLPPARIAEAKALAEMSDQEFRSYSEGLLGAPMRLEPAAHHARRLSEALDTEKLSAVSESARVAASGGRALTETEETTANEAILEAHRAALRATGRARSPFWR